LSILTKIFVILVAVLSILLVGLIVPFVAKVEDFRGQLQQEQERRLTAERTVRLRQAEITALQDRESERIKELRGEIATLTSQGASLTEELAGNRSQLQEAKSMTAKREADISSLTAANNQFASTLGSLQAELRQRREQSVEQATRMIQLADRNNELESQLDSLTRQVRRLREQMTAMQGRNEELEVAFERLDPAIRREIFGQAPQTSEASRTFTPTVRISGTVTEVQKLDDEMFIEVNIGRNDGVLPDMQFWVHRGGEYVGTLVITKVDATAAAGRMRLVEREVVRGDAVLTGSGL